MKKQFFRVKQLADQTFSRGGKTDVLSDDLQEADRKVEYIKNSCQNIGKKLLGCLLLGQVQGESGTKEKLMKKSPNYQLGISMIECGVTCDDESLMKTVLSKCGNAEKILSEESMEHDLRVEQHIITPLQNVLETEIPNIVKQKRNVTKVCLDLDSVKTRYHQAQKHNANNMAGTAKIESIKEELKDCEQKVEQSRDILASEMFHLAARESELCYTILQYYKFQKHYHEYALGILDKLIPELENVICSSKTKPVYGVDLEDHLHVTGRKIAFPIELCVCALLELGMDEEGLFRLAGGASKLKRMKLSFDAGCMTLSTALAYRDPHVIAGALKSYLRELPEPLLTHSLYDEWLNAAKAQTHPDNKLQALWTVVHKLPKANFDNLSYLIKFFHILSKNHEVNRMSPHNLAIVIAPSLIWTKEENGGGTGFGLNVNVSLYPSIIDLLVTYADWFFDKDMDFYVTLEPIINGDLEEKLSSEKGIDNKGFDLKVADKMHRSIAEKASGQNNPAGDAETNALDIKRSQSTNSLSEEVHTYDSPKPIMRRKNKSVAPGPPVFKDDRKKDTKGSKISSSNTKGKESQTVNEKPDKPPRPITTSTATLPRSSKIWEVKSSEASEEESKGHANDDLVLSRKLQTDITEKSESININSQQFSLTLKNQVGLSERKMALKATLDSSDKAKPEADTKPVEYSKVNLISVKKEWLLGKDSVENENLVLKKPAVPERPSVLKSQNFKFNRSSLGTNFRNNYENIALTSNETTSIIADDKTLQKTQFYSIDKQKVSIIEVENDKKKSFKLTINTAVDDDLDVTAEKQKEISAEEKPQEPLLDHDDGGVTDNIDDQDDDYNDDAYDDDKDIIISAEEEKTATCNITRLAPLTGIEKPERPPKPDYKISQSSSSHTRTLSESQIIENKPSDKNTFNNNKINISNSDNNGCSQSVKNVFNNDGCEAIGGTSLQQQQVSTPPSPHPASSFTGVIKHPQTSPPPPPVPAKPRANSQSESTDF